MLPAVKVDRMQNSSAESGWGLNHGAMCDTGQNIHRKTSIAMDFRRHTPNDSQAIVSLFKSVFTKSEGEAEGALVSQLARDLLEQTDDHDMDCFIAVDDHQILGSIFFSRLVFEHPIEAFILAPVAVHSDHQGQGIGQALINYGLAELKNRGVKVVLTYGDPGFYHRVGFHSISHETIRAPFPLSQPDGWLGQSLSDDSIQPLSGQCACVEALRNPTYW